jgi:hypothetical protein
MSENNPWKLATFVLAGAVFALGAAGALFAYSSRQSTAPAAAVDAAVSPSAAMQAPPGALPAPNQVGPAPAVPPTPERHLAAHSSPSSAPATGSVQRSSTARPAAADIESCNRYASSEGKSRTQTAIQDGLIGALGGAALGAAGGAIAGGGKGAGKGAAIGGLVGAAGGSLYGINSANQANAAAQAAYQDCMARRGYRYASD